MGLTIASGGDDAAGKPRRPAIEGSCGRAEPRSGYGTVPGAELPPFVYISVFAAFAWVMLASLLAFAHEIDADLALGIAIVLGVVFFALPIIIRHAAVAFSHPKQQPSREFCLRRSTPRPGGSPAPAPGCRC